MNIVFETVAKFPLSQVCVNQLPMGVDGLVNIRYNKYFAHQVAFCRPSLVILAMSSESSHSPLYKNPGAGQRLGALVWIFLSPRLSGSTQLHRQQIFTGVRRSFQLQLFTRTLEPWHANCCLMAQMNLAFHSAFFGIRHSLGVKSCLETDFPQHQVLLCRDAFLYFFEIRSS